MERPPSSRDRGAGGAATWTLLEDRGATHVLGFALMFSIVVTTFAIYQADVVSHQNEQVEFEHNQGVAEGFKMLHGTVTRATHGVPAAATLQTGATYPKRAVAVNSPDPRGRLWTGETHTVDLTDIEPADGSYWSGGSPSFETRLVTYRAAYNHIDGATYSLEHGVPTKHYNNGQERVLGDSNVIDGTRIDLILLAGDFERTGRSTTVEFQPVSSSTEYETLKQQSSELTLPTELTESEWESLVPSHVDVSVDTGPEPNEVTLELDDSRTYQLRITKLKIVGEGGSATRPPVEMLTTETATPLSVNPDEVTPLTVTARDKYGNPVSGIEVRFTPSDAAIGSTKTVRTDDSGEATYRISPSTTVAGDVTATVVGGTESATFSIQEPSSAADDTSMAIYTSGQMMEQLGDVDGLTLSEARTVPSSDEDCLLLGDTGGGLIGGLIGGLNCDTDQFRTAQGQLQFTASGGDYQLRYFILDSDGDGDVTDGDDKVLVEVEAAASDETVFAGNLDDNVANDVLDDSGVDILDVSNYDSGSVSWDDDQGCYAQCGVLDGADQEGHESSSPYDDGDGDGGYTSFDDIDLSGTEVVFVERALGRVTVTPD
jgi:hypothetical protein